MKEYKDRFNNPIVNFGFTLDEYYESQDSLYYPLDREICFYYEEGEL